MKLSLTLGLLATLLLASAPVQAEVIAFVGEPIAAALSQKSCTEYLRQSDNADEICLSRAYELRYSVRMSLYGENIGETVEFVGFYHYGGLPDYTQYDQALVILERIDGELILQRIESAHAADSGWRVCEEWPDEYDSDCLSWKRATQVVKDFLGDN